MCGNLAGIPVAELPIVKQVTVVQIQKFSPKTQAGRVPIAVLKNIRWIGGLQFTYGDCTGNQAH